MANLEYLANYNILFDTCDFIIITNIDKEIIKILQCNDDNKKRLETNLIECEVHNEHKLGEYINIRECESFPNYFKTFQSQNDLFTYLSTVGNRSTWAGYNLQLITDADGELFCVFNSEDGKSYGGWVATHKHMHLGYPRTMKLTNNNDTIEVLVDMADEYYGQIFVKYEDYIAYGYNKGEQVPKVMEDIKQRLSICIL
jgi:hypothetical protein